MKKWKNSYLNMPNKLQPFLMLTIYSVDDVNCRLFITKIKELFLSVVSQDDFFSPLSFFLFWRLHAPSSNIDSLFEIPWTQFNSFISEKCFKKNIKRV